MTRSPRRLAAISVVLTVSLGLLAGCDIPGLPSSSSEDKRGESSASGGATGDSWGSYVPGFSPKTAAPYPNTGTAPTAKKTLPPLTTSPLTTAPLATVSPSPPPDPCPGRLREGPYGGLSVTPSAGSAVVSWPNAGESAVKEYRVAAVPQDIVAGSQPDLNWSSVAPGTGCQTMSTTVSGLTSGAGYIFWVDAVYQMTYRSYPQDRTVFTSGVTQIP